MGVFGCPLARALSFRCNSSSSYNGLRQVCIRNRPDDETLRPISTACSLNMAPIRRYLRISKYSVLECRIFLENPADGPRWLLNPQDPALPRVFEAIRPLVLPKLREENERAKGKGKKKKSVKDVVTRGSMHSSLALLLLILRTTDRRL